MTPNEPSFLVFLPLCNLSPLNVAQPSDMLAINRLSQKWVGVTFKVRLQKYCDFLLAFFTLWVLFSGEASCHLLSSLMERFMWKGPDFSGQQPRRIWGIVSNQMNEVGSRLSHNQALRWLQPWLTLWSQPCERPEREAASLATTKFLIHRNCEAINVHCFKPLSFGVICYVVIDN